VASARQREVGGSLAAARAMAMATKRVMMNTTIKFKWWHGREADEDDDDTTSTVTVTSAVAGKEGGEERGEGGRRG
jgi:hypothetical protein